MFLQNRLLRRPTAIMSNLNNLTNIMPPSEQGSPREDALHSKPLFDKIYEKIKNDIANERPPAPPQSPVNGVRHARFRNDVHNIEHSNDVWNENTVSRANLSSAPISNHSKLSNLRSNYRHDRVSNLTPMVPSKNCDDDTSERRKFIIDINLCDDTGSMYGWDNLDTQPCFPCFPNERDCSTVPSSNGRDNLELPPTKAAVLANMYNISQR